MSLAQVPVGLCHAGADHVLPGTCPLWFRKHRHVWCLGPAILGQKTKAISLGKRRKTSRGPGTREMRTGEKILITGPSLGAHRPCNPDIPDGPRPPLNRAGVRGRCAEGSADFVNPLASKCRLIKPSDRPRQASPCAPCWRPVASLHVESHPLCSARREWIFILAFCASPDPVLAAGRRLCPGHTALLGQGGSLK